MRVALFFDGKNFYENLERARGGRHHLNYRALSDWLVERVGGTRKIGAHYYTGVPDQLDPYSPEYKQLRGLLRFLDSLEYVEGFFVYRFPRMRRMSRCPACGVSTSYTEEKEVDTSMVADMIRLAAADAYEVLILASGDADHSPAVEAVRAMGKIVYLASWGDEALSPRLRRAAYGHIDLLRECPPEILGDEVRAVLEGDEPAVEEDEAAKAVEVDPEMAGRVCVEVARAQGYFEDHGGYLGRGYFIHRWRGRDIPSDVELRETILDHLVERGEIEEIQILGETALRAAEPSSSDAGSEGREASDSTPEGATTEQPAPPAAAGQQGAGVTETLPFIPAPGDLPRSARSRSPEPAWVHHTLEQHVFPDEKLKASWGSLKRAEDHFRYRGFVGRGYFLTKWRDAHLTNDIAARERLLTRLIELGLVEQYTVEGTTALRTVGASD